MVRGAKAQCAAGSSASFMQYMYRYNFGALQVTVGQGQKSRVALCGSMWQQCSGSEVVGINEKHGR